MKNPKMGLNDVQEYWRDHGRRELGHVGDSPKKRDEFLQRLIEDEIIKWLRPGMSLLDIGCGDGTSTLRFAEITGSAVGIDYAKERVEKAINNAKEKNSRKVKFVEGDVLDLVDIEKSHGNFDIIVMIRCLINLPSCDMQEKAIDNVTNILKNNGLFLISEGWQEGFDSVSSYRQSMGLEQLRLVEHNLYIKKTFLENKIRDRYSILDYKNFGFYLFMSRVFQPALVLPGQPAHDHRVNETAYDLCTCLIGSNDFVDCDFAGLYALQKNG